MEPGQVSQDEARRMVSEFFVKSLNVILGARIPAKYLDARGHGGFPPPLQEDSSSSRSFNLVLVNSPLRNKCHLSVMEPIVVDVLLVQHDQMNPSGNQQHRFVSSKEKSGHASLIERWIVHCVPVTKPQDFQQKQQHQHQRQAPRSSRKKPPLCSRAAEERHHHYHHSQPSWRKAMQMLSIMLRSLYSLTRLLPAYRLFQHLNSTTNNTPPSPQSSCSPSSSSESPCSSSSSCCHFDLSYKVRTTLVASEAGCNAEDKLCKFNLAPVDTDMGRMCISVKYCSAASVEKAMQRNCSIFSDIIPDYIAGGLANPHFQVSDTRLRAPTRTKSSNIHSASVRKGAASAEVRRSYSSPLEVKTSIDDETQLVCPFASDDELENCQRMEPICCVQGTSRDAAVGALVTALRLAKQTPLNRNNQTPLTLDNALQDLRSYKRLKAPTTRTK